MPLRDNKVYLDLDPLAGGALWVGYLTCFALSAVCMEFCPAVSTTHPHNLKLFSLNKRNVLFSQTATQQDAITFMTVSYSYGDLNISMASSGIRVQV